MLIVVGVIKAERYRVLEAAGCLNTPSGFVYDGDIARDVKFGIQIGSDWHQMGQIWDFLRSVSVHFARGAKMY